MRLGSDSKNQQAKSGLLRFDKNLHSDFVRDIREWEKNPVLSKLYKTFDSQKD
jgi:hypothetical protein